MSLVKPADLGRFRTGGWRKFPVILIHGSDDGAVRELAAELVAAALGPDSDPLNHIVLDGEQIAQDPARLADEVQTFGLFGGERVIHLRNAGKCPAPVLQSVADSKPTDTKVILEAGELRAGTGLRALAEKHAEIAVIACYADNTRSLHTLVMETLSDAGLAITQDAREHLVHALGADRALSRSELEKLTLYAKGETEITTQMVHAIVSDAGRLENSTVIDAAFSGDLSVIETEANRLFASGVAVAGLMTQALNHALLLRRAKRSADDGTPPDMIARQLRLHFSRQPAFERALRLWSDQRLERVTALLSEATLQTRKLPRIADIIAIRAFWATARLSGSRQAGQ